VLSNLGSSLHDVGKVSAALLPLREALRLKEQYPELRTGALFVQVQIGNMERALGHYPEALRWLEQGRAILGEYVPKVVGAAHIGLAHLWLDLGQAARARQQLELALAIRSGPAMFHALTHLLVTRTALAQGRRDAATEALAVARTFIIDSTRYAVRAQAALLGAHLQEPEAAYANALEVAREAGRLHMMGLRIDALVYAALAAKACGRTAGRVDACARGARPLAGARARRPLHRRRLAGRGREAAAMPPLRPRSSSPPSAGSRPPQAAFRRSSAPPFAIAIRPIASSWPGPVRARPRPEIEESRA
jgi:tetratricopeptide (TPR) repeat protein